MDVGFLNHGHQRLLGRAPRFQKRREIAALAQLGDVQPDGPRAGIPLPRPVAVALVPALGRALTVPGAAHSGDLDVHQPLRGILNQLARGKSASSLLAITPGRSIMVSVIVLSFVVGR